jgi:hypothetical protein
VAEASKYFYLGRVSARLNAAQLKAAIATQQKSITTANAAATMTACAKAVDGVAKTVQAAGQQLENNR